MKDTKLFSKQIGKRKFYCWFYYDKNSIYLIPAISIDYNLLPFTIRIDFLNFSLQLTFGKL